MQIPGRGLEYKVVHLILTEDGILSDFLHSNLHISEARMTELVRLGAIYVNEERVTPSVIHRKILKGSNVRVHTEPRRYYDGNLSSRVVLKHPDYYIVDKPGGLPSHALVDNKLENVIELLSLELGEKLFITHRLDVGTNGMLIVARNMAAQIKINNLIKFRKIKRLYSAITEVPIDCGTYVHYMEPSPRAPKTISTVEQSGWLRCELIIQNCEQIDKTYCLGIELITGRSQQIRAQLGFLGAPIIGDEGYGSKVSYFDTFTKEKAIALRAESIQGLK